MAKAPEVHTTRAHARLGPSSAHRWINCPGSVKASEGLDNRSSVYAAEGTAAHELASTMLQFDYEGAAQFADHFIDIEATETQHILSKRGPANGRTIFEVDEEMIEAVDTYVEFVHGLINSIPKGVAIVDVEQRLDMTHIHPDIFGTGDAVVYDPVGEHLHVCDFKYGKGVVVGVEDNPQLLLYAAGAVRRYHNQPVRHLSMHVIQPRAAGQGIKTWDTDLLELMDFEGEIAVSAANTQKPDAPRNAGEWCRFCLAAPICPTNRESAMADALAEFSVDGEMVLPSIGDLTLEQRAHVLRSAEKLSNFVKAVQGFEHDNALRGDVLPGWKLVAKRANRAWKSKDGKTEGLLIQGLRAAKEGVDVSAIWTDPQPELKSPAQIETLFGKKAFEKFINRVREEEEIDLITKKSSGVNLVEASDPRPAVANEALAEFSAVDVEN